MRILHVEDDEDTRKLVEFILHGKGWQVVSVENATSALKLAAAGGFDLYLIDNWIEGDTENALCRGLRTLDPHTPILFYSGAVFPSDVASALASGAQGYLEKPCTPEALVEEILKLSRGSLTDCNQSRQRGTGPSPTRYGIQEMPDSELT
jgi:two-component system response regulator ResD